MSAAKCLFAVIDYMRCIPPIVGGLRSRFTLQLVACVDGAWAAWLVVRAETGSGMRNMDFAATGGIVGKGVVVVDSGGARDRCRKSRMHVSGYRCEASSRQRLFHAANQAIHVGLASFTSTSGGSPYQSYHSLSIICLQAAMR